MTDFTCPLSNENRQKLEEMQAFALGIFNRAREHSKHPVDGDDRRETEDRTLKAITAYATISQIFMQDALGRQAANGTAPTEAAASQTPPAPRLQ